MKADSTQLNPLFSLCCTWMYECREAQDVRERRLYMDVRMPQAHSCAERSPLNAQMPQAIERE
jgi:hypothetical protein